MDLLELPEIVFRKIFFFLPIQSLGRLKCTCTKLRDMDFEDYWRVHFFRHSKIPHSVDRAPSAQSWQAECERSYDQTPIKFCLELPGHTVRDVRVDGVHHVCFSHNGRLFATCSTSGEVKIWSADHTCKLFFGRNMNEEFLTICPLFAQFNATDTKLFVAAKFMNQNTIDMYCFDFDNSAFKKRPYKIETTLLDLGQVCFDSNHTLLVIIKCEQSPEISLNQVASAHTIKIANGVCSITSSASDRHDVIMEDAHLLEEHLLSIRTYEELMIVHTRQCAPHCTDYHCNQSHDVMDDENAGRSTPIDFSTAQPQENDDVVFHLCANIVEIGLFPEDRYLSVKCILKEKRLMTKVNANIRTFETTSWKTLETSVGPQSTLLSQDESQLLHLSISQLYVASVSKDNHGHLRDRQYSVPLHQFPHDEVIRCIAINPVDQEMLITVGDNVIKVWRSRRKIRQLHADR